MTRQDFILQYVLNNNPKSVKATKAMKKKAIEVYEALDLFNSNSLSFGKHKGLSIAEIPKDYLEWLMKQRPLKSDKDENTLHKELVRRGMSKDYAPDDIGF